MKGFPGFLLVAFLLGSTQAKAQAAVSVPDEVAVQRAVAEFYRDAWRFEGSISGSPVQGRLAMSLSEDARGDLAGEALLMTTDRRVLAVTTVSGRADGTDCRLQFPLGDRIEVVSGTCSPNVVAGRLVSSPRRIDLFDRLAFWWDDRDIIGEAWLAPSVGL